MNENNNIDNKVDLNKNSEADIQKETVERVYSQPFGNPNQNIDLNKQNQNPNIDMNKQQSQNTGNPNMTFDRNMGGPSYNNGNYQGFGYNPQNNINNNPNNNGMYNNSVNMVPKRNFENYTTFLVFSIIEFICCSWITGILALVFTMSANQKYQQNDMMGFESNYKTAKIMLWVGLAISVLITVFSVLYFIFILALA